MAKLQTLVAYCNEQLDAASFDDYCPNGLQVEGKPEVHKIVTGVTASLALIEAAIAVNADALLVHHGYFWKNEAAEITGMKGLRIKKLLQNNLSLLAYHLPLDAHLQWGNNRLLGENLGFPDGRPQEKGGLLWGADLTAAMTCKQLQTKIQQVLAREPLLIEGGSHAINRVAWCTGGAQSYIDKAADLGFDAYISGEISETTVHIAREREIHYFAAGHHATERYGIEALGVLLAQEFGIEHSFMDLANPV